MCYSILNDGKTVIKQLNRVLPQGHYNLVGRIGIIAHFFVYNCDKIPEREVTCSVMVHISP